MNLKDQHTCKLLSLSFILLLRTCETRGFKNNAGKRDRHGAEEGSSETQGFCLSVLIDHKFDELIEKSVKAYATHFFFNAWNRCKILENLFGKRLLASALYNDNSLLPYIYVMFSEGSKTLYRQYCSSSEYAREVVADVKHLSMYNVST